jgi:hypothetical protein
VGRLVAYDDALYDGTVSCLQAHGVNARLQVAQIQLGAELALPGLGRETLHQLAQGIMDFAAGYCCLREAGDFQRDYAAGRVGVQGTLVFPGRVAAGGVMVWKLE